MAEYLVSLDGRELHVSVKRDGAVSVGEFNEIIETRTVGNCAYSILIGDELTHVAAVGTAGEYQALVRGKPIDVRVENLRDVLLRKYATGSSGRGGHTEIRAPMPALVVKIETKVGEDVVRGQGLLVLEAMKMENEIKAHQAGKVKDVLVTEKQTVEKGELLILLE